MDRTWLRLPAVVMVTALAVSLAWLALTEARAAGVAAQQASTSDEGAPARYVAAATTADDETPPPIIAEAGAVPAAIAGDPSPSVYFVTSDNSGTATVVNLYNTDTTTRSVALRAYSFSGSLTISTTIELSPSELVRVISDDLIASPPTSWSNNVLVSFSDTTAFASLALPAGVKFDGYTVFNDATGTIDPRADQGAIPLRFSADPPTVFLPTVSR